VHELGRGPEAIVHGDLRPGRMLIVENAAKVADWANLFRWKAFEAERRITASAALKSLVYAAPEMLDGQPQPASDRYSLAIVYTALRTGAMPYRKETTPSEMQELIRKGQVELSRLTKPEKAVIEKAISLDPAERWPTCIAMVRAIQELVPT
jgi:eukaryotic-like serine/threonine-protein kinase